MWRYIYRLNIQIMIHTDLIKKGFTDMYPDIG